MTYVIMVMLVYHDQSPLTQVKPVDTADSDAVNDVSNAVVAAAIAVVAVVNVAAIEFAADNASILPELTFPTKHPPPQLRPNPPR